MHLAPLYLSSLPHSGQERCSLSELFVKGSMFSIICSFPFSLASMGRQMRSTPAPPESGSVARSLAVPASGSRGCVAIQSALTLRSPLWSAGFCWLLQLVNSTSDQRSGGTGLKWGPNMRDLGLPSEQTQLDRDCPVLTFNWLLFLRCSDGGRLLRSSGDFTRLWWVIAMKGLAWVS